VLGAARTAAILLQPLYFSYETSPDFSNFGGPTHATSDSAARRIRVTREPPAAFAPMACRNCNDTGWSEWAEVPAEPADTKALDVRIHAWIPARQDAGVADRPLAPCPLCKRAEFEAVMLEWHADARGDRRWLRQALRWFFRLLKLR